jgi:hypothetical protein
MDKQSSTVIMINAFLEHICVELAGLHDYTSTKTFTKFLVYTKIRNKDLQRCIIINELHQSETVMKNARSIQC